MAHICMFAACAPPFYCGGGKQALNLAIELAKLQHHVTFVTSNLDGAAAVHENIQGVSVHRLGSGGNTRVQLLSFLQLAMRYLIRHRDEIDIVHLPGGAFWHIVPILLLARRLNKPTILKMTALNVDDPVSIAARPMGGLFIRMLKQLNSLIAITDEFKQRCLPVGIPAQQIVLIPNGVNVNRYHPPTKDAKAIIRAQLGWGIDDPVVLFVGAIHRNKGVNELLDAWQQVQPRIPNARLVLIGPTVWIGDVDHALLAKIETLQAQGGNVTQLPVQKQIEQYYQAADIFSLPSHSEGLPNVTLEAMSTGLPVVVSDIAGQQFVRHLHDGIKVPLGDSLTLADRVVELLTDADLLSRLGGQARQTIINQFSFGIVAQQYAALYEELLD